MTGRGTQGMRPTTPPDPTLKTRPVPHSRQFSVLSFGPASANDIRHTSRSLEQMNAEIGLNEIQCLGSAGKSHVRSLLEELHTLNLPRDDENWDPDPTWGFYVFVTSYSDTALERVSKAMENWVMLTERGLMYYGPYGAEAIRRLRMDLIVDEEALSEASDDRIREEFKAQVRGLKSQCGGRSLSAGRYGACFVLDEEDIVRLAGLDLPNDPSQDNGFFGDITVKLIDRYWTWRPLGTLFTYKGKRNCSITSLAEVFELLVSNSLTLEEIHGLRHPFGP